MKYRIQNLKVKEVPSLGKSVSDLEVTDSEGKAHKGSMWSDFPGFAQLSFGSEFEADIVAKEKNGYVGYTFYPLREQKTAGGANKGFSSGMGAKLMDKKAENISKAQENKENGIKVSSTIRMAVDIVTSRNTDLMTVDEIQEQIKNWRQWLWNEWDADDSKFPPFNS